MAFMDNRQFITALEKAGEIVRIKQEVDWELEAAAIARRAAETQGPACLFEKIKVEEKCGQKTENTPLNQDFDKGIMRVASCLLQIGNRILFADLSEDVFAIARANHRMILD